MMKELNNVMAAEFEYDEHTHEKHIDKHRLDHIQLHKEIDELRNNLIETLKVLKSFNNLFKNQ